MTRMIQTLLFTLTIAFGAFAFAEDQPEAINYEELEVFDLELQTNDDLESEVLRHRRRPSPRRGCFLPRQIRAGQCYMTLRTPVFGSRIPNGARVTYADHSGYYHGWSQLICQNGRLRIWRDNVRWCGIQRRY